MRIVVNGQRAFGRAVLEALLNQGENVVGACCPPDASAQRPDPLKELALAHNLPVFQPKSFREQGVCARFARLRPDLHVMAFVTVLVPEEILSIATRGTIQYHPSLLPKHRGPSSINWAISQGDKKTGITIFWPDGGLDTGPILLQREVEINDEDTAGSLYFDKLFPLGVEAILESVHLVKARQAPRMRQDEGQATYEGWCRKEDVRIDWNSPMQEVYDVIRGASPRPGAWTTIGQEKVEILEAGKVPGAGESRPGEVAGITGDGVKVSVRGGEILVKRVKPEGGEKTAATEFARGAGLVPGDVLE